ncbi:MAG: hypothetical protein HUK02_01815 [Bacteroidaceae bacterium]|nr:hypothetical protein [Bacteroidaceae bacterium]
MKRKQLFLTIALLAMGTAAQAQSVKQAVEFKPIATGMMSLYSEFPDEGKALYGFQLDRAYLGVEGKWGKGWSVKFVTDCGKSSAVDDYQRIVYIKNALVQWKNGQLSVRAGLIGTNVFGTQEKFWGRRYVMKSFQDEYKFGSSADLGAALEWTPTKVLSLDAIVVNGEGYKKLQAERGLLYGVGVTVKPVTGLVLRAYGDLNQRPDGGTPQKTLNALAGYKNDAFSIAVEADFLFDKDGTKAKNQSGLSAYGSARAGKCDIFARYDLLASKNDWNRSKDGSMALVGVDVNLCKFVKIAPNVKLWIPKDGKATPSVNVNFQFAL